MLSSASGKTTSAKGSFGSSSTQTYQSREGLSFDRREARNHGCWSEVWFTTRSTMIRMPRSFAVRTNATRSPRDPRLGSTE